MLLLTGHLAQAVDTQQTAGSAERSTRLAVLDVAIPWPDLLAAGADRDLAVHLGTRAPDPVLEALAGASRPVRTLHLVSHGSPGYLSISGKVLGSQALATMALGWAPYLAPGATIVLYGCSAGQGVSGRQLVDDLARATGAHVIASSTPTGAAARGGNWRFDISSNGTVPDPDVISAFGASHKTWPGLLDVITNTNDAGAGSLRAAAANVPGNADLRLDTLAGTITLNTGTVTVGDGTSSGDTGLRLTGSTDNLTIDGNDIDLNLNNNNLNIYGTGATLNLTINSNITGSGLLVIGDSDSDLTVTLGGINTMVKTTGGAINTPAPVSILVESGDTLSISNGAALGSGKLVLSDGTLAVTGATTIGNGIALDVNDGTINNSADVTVSGVISGSNDLTKTGAGTLTLTGTNIYEQTTTVKAGTLSVSADSNLGKRGLILDGGNLTVTGATTIDNDVTLNANATVTSSADVTLSGVISGANKLTKAGANTLTLSGTNTYSGTTAVDAGTLSVSSDSNLGAGVLTLNGGNLTVTGATTIDNAIALSSNATVTNSANATLSGVISGANKLTKAGASTLTLSGTNTYSGTTTVDAGTLSVSADSNLGTGALTLNGGNLTVTGATTIDNAIALSSNATITNSANATLSGVISGANKLTKAGASTLTLSGTNTYSGTTTVDAGTLSVGGDSNLGTGALTLNGGNLTVTGATTIDNAIALGSNATVTNSANATLSGVISGANNLTKAGTNTLTLSGTNTYSGTTTVSAGTLRAGAANTFSSSSALTAASGTTVDLNGFAQSIGSIAGAGTVSLGAGTLTSGGNNNSTTLSGAIGGSGALVKTGTGTLTLSGTNTYAGTTAVHAGTLSVSADSNLGAGALTLNGGNLTVTGATTIDNAVALSSNATVTNSANATLAGVISGASNLTKSGASTLTLSGANTYSGTTTISAGTLQIGAGGTAGALAGDVVNNAQLAFARNNAYTHAGDVSGTGSVANIGAGTTSVTGAMTHTGGTTIGSGALQIGDGGTTGSISGSIANNSVLVFNRSDAVTFANVISGTGTFTQAGTGRTNLTGANTYNGVTSVNAGTLSVNGSIANSATAVNSGGTLGGTGTVGSVTVNNGGSFAPGNSIGTINVAGDVVFTAGSHYNVEVGAAGNADKIVATGAATLTGGTVNVKPAAGTYANVTDYTILTAAAPGGLGGTTFASVNSSLAFLTSSLSYNTNNVFLRLTRNDVSFSNVASTPNQTAVSLVLDSNTAALQSIVNNIYPLTSVGAQQAFDSLSGVQHAQTQLVVNQLGHQFQQLLSIHGSQSTHSALRLKAQAVRPTRGYLLADNTNDRPADMFASSDVVASQRGWWVKGVGGRGLVDATTHVRGADYQSGGMAAGVDADWDDFVVGIAGSYTRSSVEPFAGGSTIDSFQAGAYGSWERDGVYVDASLGLGLHQVDATRTVTVGSSVSIATSNYDSMNVSTAVEAGKDIKLDAATTLTPYIGASYSHNKRDSFFETGSGAANLSAKAEGEDSLRTTLGLRISRDIQTRNNRTITPAFSVAYVREHLDSVSAMDAGFATVPTSTFRIEGNDLDRNRLQIGVGVSGQLNANTTLNVRYDRELAGSDDHQGFAATLNIAW